MPVIPALLELYSRAVTRQVMNVLEHSTRKQMAVTIVRSVLKGGTLLQEVEQASRPD